MESRTPPQDLEAEMSVLGSIMLDNDSFAFIEGVLGAEDFYKEGHRKIFRACAALFEKAEPVDLVTLTDELRRSGDLEKVGSVPYLIGLADNVPTAAYAESYAGIVREKRVLRDLISASGSVMQSAYDQALPLEEILEKAEQGIYHLAITQTGENFSGMAQLTAEVSQSLAELQNSGVKPGVSTGFTALDDLLGGLEPGSLYILAARPSQGKTALALSITHNAARMGYHGAFFSLEMSGTQLTKRLLAMEGRIDSQRLRTGELGGRDWQRIADTLGRLSELGINIDDSPNLSIAEFRSRSRRLASRNPLGFIVVDYLQLMSAPGGNREQEIATISRGLKAVARELDVPVLALAQLSREVERRPNKRPIMSDLRESGAIENDADAVMFIYRDDYYREKLEPSTYEPDGKAEIIIGKQRNGPTGTVVLNYLNSHTRFTNLATAADEQAAEAYREMAARNRDFN